ncbi:phosphatidate cytidylyltransferase [Allohahella marinimesophila]|uniref:Phosphatidate cytidylyltransferase n=1 Tax=Allohahella marinimesophila TaxID=1054972 RepID=A0ABP7PQS2_9GAMM
MLKQRVITALVLVTVFGLGLFATTPGQFALFLALIFALGAWELGAMSGLSQPLHKALYVLLVLALIYCLRFVPISLVLAAGLLWWLACTVLVKMYPSGVGLWNRPGLRMLAGVLILVPAWAALMQARVSSIEGMPSVSGAWLIFYIFVIVWIADIGAYFSGKRFGKRKLAPRVSPGKSIEGLIGGLLAVLVLPVGVALYSGAGPSAFIWLTLVTLFAAALSVVGDLTESLLKRVAGVKDSGKLLPGHGGIMDRIDSVTAAAPVFMCVMLLSGWLAAQT